MNRIDSATRDAYLRALGLEAEPPSVDALSRLHRAQVERVPWETLWIHLGASWSVDPGASAARIAAQRRGGYCFHLNGAFSGLLAALGYHVTRHVGGVHGPDGPTEAEMTNHLVLTVSDLPTDDNPAGSWYVDVGLGDALYEPLPLVAGEYEQAPFRLSLEESSGVGAWHLTHDPSGGFAGMAWRSEPTEMDAFVDRHTFLSTSPESGFVKVLAVQRRDATGADVLRGLTFVRLGDSAPVRDIGTQAELHDLLGDLFGVDLGAIGAPALDALWARSHAAHEKWVALGRP
jgi:N-hydroxyarylamine O-acetyltransferase